MKKKMMGKKIAMMLALCMLFTTLLCGCQSGGGAGGGSVKIYFSMIESAEYYQNWATMAQEKAAEEGVQLDIEYAEKSIETQVEQVQKAVSEGYDAIICSLVSPDIANEVKAIAGSTPIVFVNSAPAEEELAADRYVYVASEDTQPGQFQAEYILEQLASKDELNVVILKGPKGRSTTKGRTNGAKKTLAASGKKINYVFDDHADFNPDKAKEIYGEFLKVGVTPDCVICNNDNMALGAIAACEEAGVDMSATLVLGVDASGDGCQAIKDGKMAFSVFQNVRGQSEAAALAAIRLAGGGSIEGIEGATEDCKYIWIPFEKVDSSNVAQYSN